MGWLVDEEAPTFSPVMAESGNCTTPVLPPPL